MLIFCQYFLNEIGKYVLLSICSLKLPSVYVSLYFKLCDHNLYSCICLYACAYLYQSPSCSLWGRRRHFQQKHKFLIFGAQHVAEKKNSMNHSIQIIFNNTSSFTMRITEMLSFIGRYSRIWEGLLVSTATGFFVVFCFFQLVGSQFPYQELNPRPQQWKSRVLTTGPPGNSLPLFYFIYFFKLSFIYLVVPGLSCRQRAPQLWHANSQLRHACGIQFPDQGSNPGPLHWEHRALTTAPPGKSLPTIILILATALLITDLSPVLHCGLKEPYKICRRGLPWWCSG